MKKILIGVLPVCLIVTAVGCTEPAKPTTPKPTTPKATTPDPSKPVDVPPAAKPGEKESAKPG